MAEALYSFKQFVTNHAWALIVALILIGTNYGIMTSQISTMENEINRVEYTVDKNTKAVMRIRLERSADITEIQTILKNILNEHTEYTTELKEINNRFMQMYQQTQTQRNPK